MRLSEIHDAVAVAGVMAGKDTIRARVSRLMADDFVHHRQHHGYYLEVMTDMANVGVRYALPDGSMPCDRLGK